MDFVTALAWRGVAWTGPGCRLAELIRLEGLRAMTCANWGHVLPPPGNGPRYLTLVLSINDPGRGHWQDSISELTCREICDGGVKSTLRQ